MALALGDRAGLVGLLDAVDLLLRGVEEGLLLGGDAQVGDGERQARHRRVAEADLLHRVEQVDGERLALACEGVVDHARRALLAEGAVVVGHAVGQDLAEDQAAERGDHAAVRRHRLGGLLLVLHDLAEAGEADLDRIMERDAARVAVGELEAEQGLFHVFEAAHGLGVVAVGAGQEVHAHDDVLRRADDRVAVRRAEDVVRRHHQHVGLGLRLDRQRQVDRHLVAVEVGVVAGADERVDLDRVALDQHRLERLDTHAVQGRRAVQHDRVVLDHLLEDVPHLGIAALEHALGALDRVGEAVLLELADDERLEQLERDLLGKAALPDLELGTDDDDRTRRVVDALAEQVLAEAALLALDHVGDRLERAVRRAEHRAAAAAVVEQRVDRLLQHALLVAHDDLGRIEVHELLEAVVAVDDAAVEIVEIAGREVAALEQDERAQVRRDHGDHVEDHPLRLVLRALDLLDDLEALGEVLLALLRLGVAEVLADLLGQALEVELLQELADRLGAHHRGEGRGAVLVDGLAVLVLGQDLLVLELGLARVGDDVVLEVDDLLEVRGLHRQQVAQARRHRLEEPDVHDRRGQVDVAHALAAHAAVRDLDAAAVADDALVLRALVLAAGALVVLLGTEDALAEQTVTLGSVRAVVDGLRLLDLAEAPASDVVRARKGDLDGAVVVHAVVDALGHRSCLPNGPAAAGGFLSCDRTEQVAGTGLWAVTAGCSPRSSASRAGCSCQGP